MEIAATPWVPPLVRIGRYAQAQPLLFGAIVSASKTTLADCLVQFGLEGKSLSEWDTKRTLVFTAFGFGFMGIAQYFLIARLPAYIFPSSNAYAAKTLVQKAGDLVGTRNVALQVAWDQLVVMPTLFLPAYYTLKAFAISSEESMSERIFNGLKNWRENFWEDIQASWMIWVPAQIVNFGMVPLHYRIPFVAIVSTAYTAVLSHTRGEDPELDVEMAMDGLCAQTVGSPKKSNTCSFDTAEKQESAWTESMPDYHGYLVEKTEKRRTLPAFDPQNHGYLGNLDTMYYQVRPSSPRGNSVQRERAIKRTTAMKVAVARSVDNIGSPKKANKANFEATEKQESAWTESIPDYESAWTDSMPEHGHEEHGYLVEKTERRRTLPAFDSQNHGYLGNLDNMYCRRY